MADITHGTWIKDGKAVDKVFSNGKQVYGRNLWAMSKVVAGYLPGATGIPFPYAGADAMIPDSFTIPDGVKSIVMTLYNPNKLVNNQNSDRVSFFNGSTYLGLQLSFNLAGDTVQTVKWDIPAEATKVYLSSLLGANGASVFDSSIRVKYEFGDKATPWTPAPEDILK